jgi:hypothetical protein
LPARATYLGDLTVTAHLALLGPGKGCGYFVGLILGHSRLAVTPEIYSHEDKQAYREAFVAGSP